MDEDLKGLNLVELFDLLEPVPAPDPVSMMPQTVGWIWLGVAILALMFLIVRKARKHRKENAYRRQALLELRGISDPKDQALLLRRTALAAYPRKDVASLYGAEWLTFLNGTCEKPAFSSEGGKALLEAPYASRPETEDIKPQVLHWIRFHRRGAA